MGYYLFLVIIEKKYFYCYCIMKRFKDENKCLNFCILVLIKYKGFVFLMRISEKISIFLLMY